MESVHLYSATADIAVLFQCQQRLIQDHGAMIRGSYSKNSKNIEALIRANPGIELVRQDNGHHLTFHINYVIWLAGIKAPLLVEGLRARKVTLNEREIEERNRQAASVEADSRLDRAQMTRQVDRAAFNRIMASLGCNDAGIIARVEQHAANINRIEFLENSDTARLLLTQVVHENQVAEQQRELQEKDDQLQEKSRELQDKDATIREQSRTLRQFEPVVRGVQDLQVKLTQDQQAGNPIPYLQSLIDAGQRIAPMDGVQDVLTLAHQDSISTAIHSPIENLANTAAVGETRTDFGSTVSSGLREASLTYSPKNLTPGQRVQHFQTFYQAMVGLPPPDDAYLVNQVMTSAMILRAWKECYKLNKRQSSFSHLSHMRQAYLALRIWRGLVHLGISTGRSQTMRQLLNIKTRVRPGRLQELENDYNHRMQIPIVVRDAFATLMNAQMTLAIEN